ncbi:sulfatase [Candidatus Aerophobetes bacterium]|nr:sulfatase [Candidatus Aerophobetes bacterium]
MVKLNIVEIIWHDLGDWLSCYKKDPIPSPSLQKMAEEGVVFENHFCTAPQCSPSRSSIMTGRYPHSNGIMGLTHRGWEYNKEEKDLPHLLTEIGYNTYLFGHQHEYNYEDEDKLAQMGYQHSYSSSWRSWPWPCDKIAKMASRFFKEEAPRKQPFFVSIGYGEVHRNYGTKYDPEILNKITIPGFLPNLEIVQKDIATFYENIKRADLATGHILEAIRKSGLEENTLVFFTTDHGPEFPRAKMTLYDPGIKTALIMKYPGRLKPGKRIKQLISNVDIFPTILEAIGIQIPENVQGKSFWPLLLEKEYTPREEIYAELTWHTLYDPMRAIRTTRYKYIYNFQPGYPILMGGPPAQRYGVKMIEKYYGQPRPKEELYDLKNDPWEKNNLAGKNEYKKIKAELCNRLMSFLKETKDPILKGPIPHPGKKGYECFWVKEDEQFKLKITRDFKEYPLK